MKIKIISLSLSDKDSYLEVTYHLNMTWRDLRLRYHNLKEASRLNQVIFSLWICWSFFHPSPVPSLSTSPYAWKSVHVLYLWHIGLICP